MWWNALNRLQFDILKITVNITIFVVGSVISFLTKACFGQKRERGRIQSIDSLIRFITDRKKNLYSQSIKQIGET